MKMLILKNSPQHSSHLCMKSYITLYENISLFLQFTKDPRDKKLKYMINIPHPPQIF